MIEKQDRTKAQKTLYSKSIMQNQRLRLWLMPSSEANRSDESEDTLNKGLAYTYRESYKMIA